MAVITIWNNTEEQCGSTCSSIALATQMGIDKNMKILLISTSFDEDIIKSSFWTENKSRLSFLGGKTSIVEQNGISALDRFIRSNKTSADVVKNYTNVVFKDRLEILLGIYGDKEQYLQIKEKYPTIVSLARMYYDFVIIDLDKSVGINVEKQLLEMSDIVIPLIPQRAKVIERNMKNIAEQNILKPLRTIYAIGRYMDFSKYNAKNITRSIIKQKEIVNTIPYNALFFEAVQEGKVADLFINFIKLKERDQNQFFISELRRLEDTIVDRLEYIKMLR